jgi:hypothetical protein
MYRILLLAVLSTLTGCFPAPLPVGEIPVAKPKIVISSQMVPKQGLVVTVTKSLGALDAGENSNLETIIDQIVVDDATVTIHYQNHVDTLVNLDNGLYGTTTTEWKEGIPYELQVSTNDFGEVKATTEVVKRVPFNDASLTLVRSSGIDSMLQVDYSLNDPVGKNFYVISVQRYRSNRELSDYIEPRIFNHLIDDSHFDGEHYANNFRMLWPRFHQGDTVALFMSSVSEEYYRFLEVQKNSEFSLVEFISEPMNYPTNVQGGYGFFNLHFPDVKVFELGE